jgi:hypothetical protein
VVLQHRHGAVQQAITPGGLPRLPARRPGHAASRRRHG